MFAGTGFLFLLALVFSAFAVSPATASERRLTLADLTEQSDIVVRATIKKSAAGYRNTDHGKLPFLIYNAQTRSVLSGRAPRSFTLRVPAAAGKSGINPLPGGPAFSIDREYVLFLKRAESDNNDVFELVSIFQGSLPVIFLKERGEVVPVPLAKPVTKRSFIYIRFMQLDTHVKAVQKNLEREK